MSIMIRVIAMNENLFLWGIWLLWCLVTFFMGKSIQRTYYGIGLLLLSICVPYTLELSGILFPMSLIFLLLYSFLGLVLFPLKLKKYLPILLFAYLYVIYFLWRFTSPIFDDSWFVTLAIVFSTVVFMFVEKQFQSKILMWCTSLAIGHTLYTFICWSYYLQYNINFQHFYNIFVGVIVLFTIQHFWKTFMRKVDVLLQVIESKKVS